MNELGVYRALLLGWLALALGTFVLLFFVVAPYGRHSRTGWGPSVSQRVGWILMEAPASLLFGLFFVLGQWPAAPTSWVFLGLWELHYVYRAFVYPAVIRPSPKRTPVVVVGMAILFNSVNTYLNGRYLFTLSGGYLSSWLHDPRFLAGSALFLLGMVVNHRADAILRGLRRPGDAGYRIPEGFLYRYISCPNYAGEILEWTGWALATWSWGGVSFLAWTVANLAPRAWAHHRWYRETFPDYPRTRRALIPGLW
ncbi:MAG: DUF1295 domain-containing protein [Deltaproteobacteria bacterium]|nr:DUF1295 domain-containing protein [Deltaproteobacteria bacterium]